MLKKAVGEGNQDILRPLVDEYLYLCDHRINASEAEMRRLALAYGRMAIRANESWTGSAPSEGRAHPKAVPSTRCVRIGTMRASGLGQDVCLPQQRGSSPLR